MRQHIAELVRASLHGAADVESSPTSLTPLRLPLSARARLDSEWMKVASAQASEVRCEFRTAATWIEMTVETTGLSLPWVPEPGEPAVARFELPDGLHPSPAGYLRIADRFAESSIVSTWIARAAA